MKWWKELGLGIYFAATQNARRRDATARVAAGQMPMIVLFYHRVANSRSNAWTLDTQTFASQILWLKKRFDLVTLEEAQRRIASGSNRWPTASITFDDGYADNCDFALPLLLREKIPFTYFVTTRPLLDQSPFSHDVESGQPLRPNTPEQIRALADAGVEIGAHTRTHADIGRMSDLALVEDEIVGSKTALETLIERPVRYFAFPYGLHENLSGDAFRVAHATGFAGVCSAYGGYNFPGDDPFHLQRIHADPQSVRFKNWLTVDPRKLRMVQRFEPGDYREPPLNTPAAENYAEFAVALVSNRGAWGEY